MRTGNGILKRTITLVCTSLLFLFQFSTHTPLQAQPNRPKVAVVLSGGGAKGVAHISALKAIEQAGIPIDIITGTSMGALIGGLYATGWSTDELDSLVRHQDWTYLLTDRIDPSTLDINARQLQNTYALWHIFNRNTLPGVSGGMFRGTNLDHLFDHLLMGYLDSISFDSLPIPFACVATDIVTNTEIDFHRGYLKQAMRASMSIPGVFSPVRIGKQILVDGGMRNNYPADLARKMGADIIIGVSVQGDTLAADNISNAIDVLMQIVDLNCKNKCNENIAISDIYMNVDVSGYSAASFTAAAVDTLLRRGTECAQSHWNELLALRRTNNIDSLPLPKRHRYIPKTNNLREKLTASPNPLSSNIAVGVAFRFDNEETGTLQLATSLPLPWSLPQVLSLRLRLGKRFQFNINQDFFPNGITSPSIAYTYSHNDIDIYNKGIRSYNTKYNQHTLKFSVINSRWKLYEINAGARFDYLDYYDPILTSQSTAIEIPNEHLISYFFNSTLNTENNWYYPTSGIFFQTTFAYHTDNFFSYNNLPGYGTLKFVWRAALSPHPKFVIQPGFFGRFIIGKEHSIFHSNTVGSMQNIVEQQIYFPGATSISLTDDYLLGFNINLRLNFANKRYIFLHFANARIVQSPEQIITQWPQLFGLALGYAHDTFLGPLEASFGYSSLSTGLNFYLNIGHRF